MRLKCEYKTSQIPVANRMMWVSLFKEALKKVNKDYYEKLYYFGEKNNKQSKNFCFSTYLKDFRIDEDLISIKDRVILNISTSDYEFGINIYNGLLQMNTFKYKGFILEKIKISLVKENFIGCSEITVKTMSPICIKDKEGKFLSPNDENYEKELNYAANQSLINSRGYGLYEELAIEPVSIKKVVVKEDIRDFKANANKDIFYVTAYGGIFKLRGHIEDLNMIYQNGLGLRRGQGFGMIELL